MVAVTDESTYRGDLEFRDLGYVVLVIDTVAKKIAKIA